MLLSVSPTSYSPFFFLTREHLRPFDSKQFTHTHRWVLHNIQSHSYFAVKGWNRWKEQKRNACLVLCWLSQFCKERVKLLCVSKSTCVYHTTEPHPATSTPLDTHVRRSFSFPSHSIILSSKQYTPGLSPFSNYIYVSILFHIGWGEWCWAF